MKFLIHGNTPNVTTGYGVQGRYLADRLTRDGHEVAFSSTYGQQFGIGTWKTPHGHDVRLYPNGIFTNSPDTIIAHAEHFFEGDPKAGWIIPLIDVWSLNVRAADLRGWQVAAWAPVDHFPCPKGVLGFFEMSNALPIAMSRFGERMFQQAGVTASYVPLAVDTAVYKPTFTIDINGETVTARQLFRIPDDAFVVGMVAMNKDPLDRKGFNEALRAFGRFWRNHQNAVMLVHTEQNGAAGGYNLAELAAHCGVPEHTVIYSDQYAYRIGFPPTMMAAAYTAMDVLLAPSHGEGFCVPLIEAQACGTPVISSDFSAQPELVGAGWTVTGQLWWDAAQSASYVVPFVADVIDKLELAFAADLEGMQAQAIEFAAQYDVDRVYAEHWKPLLDRLLPVHIAERPAMESVTVIVPAVRQENEERLRSSFHETAPAGVSLLMGEEGTPTRTYAENVNQLVAKSDTDFVLIVGDDVEFLPGWFEAAQAVSTRADIIGTNDSEPGRIRNADVAAGRHADHFFIRRSYIDDVGSSLDGPGVAMPTAYRHWFVDREVIELARARGVFVFAEDCRIIHHHPGYDGNEAAREADPVYMAAVNSGEDDRKTFMKRAPLIEAHRVRAA